MAATAIVNATLIDGHGGPAVTSSALLFEGETIIAAGRGSDVVIPEGAAIVDASGQWIIPGILNGNVHLLDAWLMCGPGGVEYLSRWEGQLVDVNIEAAQVTLRQGVTSVFDTYNAIGPVLTARDRIAAGDAVGSRIFAAGNIIGMGGPFSVDFCAGARPHVSQTFANRMDALFAAGVGAELTQLNAKQVRPIIRDYIQRGVDMIKIAVSDHAVKVVGFDRTYLTFSEAVLEVMLDEAHSAGVPALSHTTHLESLRIAVELGFDVLIHGSMVGFHHIPDELVQRIVEKGPVVGIQAAPQAYGEKLMRNGHFFGPLLTNEIIDSNDRKIIAAGAPVMLGTDAGCTSHDVLHDLGEHGHSDRPWTLGLDHVVWAEAMVEKGMTPMQAIVGATNTVAKAYRKDRVLGSIAPNKLADFVLLDKDPLDNIRNLAAVHAVYKGGERVDRDALPATRLVTGDPIADPN